MAFWNNSIRPSSPGRHQSSSNARPASGRSRGYSSRARPRDGLMLKMRKFLRDVYFYMRKHPLKVFLLVILPLITGGALAKILAQFGVRLPPGLAQMVGGAGAGAGGDRYYSRGGARDFAGGSSLPGMMSGGGGISESIGGALNIAKMFL